MHKCNKIYYKCSARNIVIVAWHITNLLEYNNIAGWRPVTSEPKSSMHHALEWAGRVMAHGESNDVVSMTTSASLNSESMPKANGGAIWKHEVVCIYGRACNTRIAVVIY